MQGMPKRHVRILFPTCKFPPRVEPCLVGRIHGADLVNDKPLLIGELFVICDIRSYLSVEFVSLTFPVVVKVLQIRHETTLIPI